MFEGDPGGRGLMSAQDPGHSGTRSLTLTPPSSELIVVGAEAGGLGAAQRGQRREWRGKVVGTTPRSAP